MERCNDCGEMREEFVEGSCAGCHHAKQVILFIYTDAYDRWNKMSDAERDVAIHQAHS